MRSTLHLRIAAAIATVCIVTIAALGAAVYFGSDRIQSAWSWAGLLLVVIAGVVACSYWLGAVLTRQLRDLAQRIQNFVPQQPNDGIAVAGQDEEIAALARAVDELRGHLRLLLQREHEFTANASDELSTPLTTLGTHCDLLLAESSLSTKARERVNQIRRAADQMTAHIQALLYLSRDERPSDHEFIALHQCIRDAAAPMLAEIVLKRVSLEIDIPEQIGVVVSRQALQIVIANLLRNAVRHTERGYVRITYDAPRLVMADSGKGIPKAQLARIFERNYAGHEKMDSDAVGLDIVKRVCDQAGWAMDVHSVVNVGSIFTITLARDEPVRLARAV